MYRALLFYMIFLLLPAMVEGASLADTISMVKPSVVGVGTYLPTRRPPNLLIGTGFVVHRGQYVLTNNHIVAGALKVEKGERLVVFTGEGMNSKALKAKVVGKDEVHDLAVLRISSTLPGLELDEGPLAREGESVAFTGFPIGAVLGLYPVTHRGMISSITPIAVPAPSLSQLSAQKISRLRTPDLVYQLDGTAYPGNSGSPLYNPETGTVIGIVNMVHVKITKEDILSKPSGISYAIPIEHARKLLGSLP